MTNDYKTSANIGKGISFGKCTDGNFFTFRPILSQNILQFTKNDAEAIFNFSTTGNTTSYRDIELYANNNIDSPKTVYRNNSKTVWSGMANDNTFFIWDTTRNRRLIEAGAEWTSTANHFHADGSVRAGDGLISTGGWLDLFKNGAQSTSLWVDPNHHGTVLMARTGALLLTNPNNYETQLRSGGLSIANNEWTQGRPVAASAYNTWSSRLIKENIKSMTELDGTNILKLRPVHFDFKKSFGGKKNNCGLIAEEVLEVIPEAVTVPEGYDETNFDESKGLKNDLLEVDYTKLVPHLIKLCQVQQEEIDDLKNRIALLEKK